VVGEKMKGEKGKGDLKGSREKPKTHAIERTGCVRSHSCLVCMCEVGSAFECIGCIQMHACRSVCVMWGTMFEQMQVSSNACPCLRLNA
jgi:hypothetical protein